MAFWDWLPWRKKAAAPKRLRRADFVGGRKNRRNVDWLHRSSDASTSIRGSLKTMRDRSRDLQRNNRYDHGAMVKLAQFFSGSVPRSAIRPVNKSDAARDRAQAIDELLRLVSIVRREQKRLASQVCFVDGCAGG